MGKFIPDYNDPYVIKVASSQIDIKDYFSGSDLYEFFHEILVREGFEDLDGDGDNWESRYIERRAPDGSKTVEVWWRMYKQINDLFVYLLKINMNFNGIKQVEITQGGKRIKTEELQFLMFFDAYLFVDPYKKFRNHPIIKYFWKRFYERLYKPRIDSEYMRLKSTYEKLIDRLRRYLALHTFRARDIPIKEHVGGKGI